MPVDLNADEIIRLAHTIVLAANPPCPQRGPDMSDKDFDKHVWRWACDLEYSDSHMSIYISPAIADGQKNGLEASIYLPDNEAEGGGKAVFIGYEVWSKDEDPATTIGEITTEFFLSGPWMETLFTVARCATAIIQARPVPSERREGRACHAC